jgi:hypothetical protein
MLEADTAQTQARNVIPKSDEESARGKWLGGKGEGAVRPPYEFVDGLFMSELWLIVVAERSSDNNMPSHAVEGLGPPGLERCP